MNIDSILVRLKLEGNDQKLQCFLSAFQQEFVCFSKLQNWGNINSILVRLKLKGDAEGNYQRGGRAAEGSTSEEDAPLTGLPARRTRR